MPTGTWPIKGNEAFSTTCSQCHTAIGLTGPSGPVICPRCRALIEALDGQPFGTPRYVSPFTGEPLALSPEMETVREMMPDLIERVAEVIDASVPVLWTSIDPGWPDEDHPPRPDTPTVHADWTLDTSGMTEDEAFQAIFGVSMEQHANDLVTRWLEEDADAVQQPQGPTSGSEEDAPV